MGRELFARARSRHRHRAPPRFTVGGATYTREAIACPVHQVIALRICADQPGRISCGVTLRSPQPGALAVDGGTLVLTGENRPETWGRRGSALRRSRAADRRGRNV